MVYFCFTSINAYACLLLHQASADSWEATCLTGKSQIDSQNTQTDWLSPSLSISGLRLWFWSVLGHRGVLFFFFVVHTTQIMAGSKQTNLSDCKIFTHTALHTNKSRASWSWILVRESGEPLVFDDHYRRKMHSGWGKRRLRGEKKLQCTDWQRRWE